MTAPEWLAHCQDLILHADPLSPDELVTFESLKAREMARAEQRRLPQPQLELGHV